MADTNKGKEEMTGSQNTDKELWRKEPSNHYSPSIHVTVNGDIGMNVGGHVLVAPIEAWFKAGIRAFTVATRPKKHWWQRRRN